MSLTTLKKTIESKLAEQVQAILRGENRLAKLKENEVKSGRDIVNLIEEIRDDEELTYNSGLCHLKGYSKIYQEVESSESYEKLVESLIAAHKVVAEQHPSPTIHYQYSQVLAGLLKGILNTVVSDDAVPASAKEAVTEHLNKLEAAEAKQEFSYTFFPSAPRAGQQNQADAVKAPQRRM